MCVGELAYFNVWGQIIFPNLFNEVVSELKSGGCRQRIIVIGPQSDFIFRDPSSYSAENALEEVKRTC